MPGSEPVPTPVDLNGKGHVQMKGTFHFLPQNRFTRFRQSWRALHSKFIVNLHNQMGFGKHCCKAVMNPKHDQLHLSAAES